MTSERSLAPLPTTRLTRRGGGDGQVATDLKDRAWRREGRREISMVSPEATIPFDIAFDEEKSGGVSGGQLRDLVSSLLNGTNINTAIEAVNNSAGVNTYNNICEPRPPCQPTHLDCECTGSRFQSIYELLGIDQP